MENASLEKGNRRNHLEGKNKHTARKFFLPTLTLRIVVNKHFLNVDSMRNLDSIKNKENNGLFFKTTNQNKRIVYSKLKKSLHIAKYALQAT